MRSSVRHMTSRSLVLANSRPATGNMGVDEPAAEHLRRGGPAQRGVGLPTGPRPGGAAGRCRRSGPGHVDGGDGLAGRAARIARRVAHRHDAQPRSHAGAHRRAPAAPRDRGSAGRLGPGRSLARPASGTARGPADRGPARARSRRAGSPDRAAPLLRGPVRRRDRAPPRRAGGHGALAAQVRPGPAARAARPVVRWSAGGRSLGGPARADGRPGHRRRHRRARPDVQGRAHHEGSEARSGHRRPRACRAAGLARG